MLTRAVHRHARFPFLCTCKSILDPAFGALHARPVKRHRASSGRIVRAPVRAWGSAGDGRPDVAQSDWFSLLAWSHSAMLPLFPSVAIGWRGLFLHSGASRLALSFL